MAHQLADGLLIRSGGDRCREIGNGGDVRVVAELDLRSIGEETAYHAVGEEGLSLLLDEGEDREDLGAEQNVRIDVAVELRLEERRCAPKHAADVGKAVGVLLDVVSRGETERAAQTEHRLRSGKHDGAAAELALKHSHHLQGVIHLFGKSHLPMKKQTQSSTSVVNSTSMYVSFEGAIVGAEAEGVEEA